MPVETPGERRRRLEQKERRKREDGVRKIEDFPLEVIEEIARYLEPEDVPKLMMVNKRLYSGYARDESIVFGDHVDRIYMIADACRINKHHGSQRFDLDSDRHLHLIKRVTSCDKLFVRIFEKPFIEAHKTILKQLKSVNHLWLYVKSITDLTNFFTHFHASVHVHAYLNFEINSFREEQSVSDLLGNFVETRLADCEVIYLNSNFEELLHVCYRALKKTRVKRIDMNAHNTLNVQWIVKHGIPSKNPEARFFSSVGDLSLEKRNEIISFVTKYPGMEQIVGEKRVLVLEQAKNWLWKYAVKERCYEILCFRRNIDLTKDCIYVICYSSDNRNTQFFAFYILSTST